MQKTTNLMRAMTGLVVLLALLIPAGMARQVLAQNPPLRVQPQDWDS